MWLPFALFVGGKRPFLLSPVRIESTLSPISSQEVPASPSNPHWIAYHSHNRLDNAAGKLDPVAFGARSCPPCPAIKLVQLVKMEGLMLVTNVQVFVFTRLLLAWMTLSGNDTGPTRDWLLKISSSKLHPRTCTISWRRLRGISLHYASRLLSSHCHSPPGLFSPILAYCFFLPLPVSLLLQVHIYLCVCRWWPGSVLRWGLLVLALMSILLVWQISAGPCLCLFDMVVLPVWPDTSLELCPTPNQAHPVLVWVPRLEIVVLDSCKHLGGMLAMMAMRSVVVVDDVQWLNKHSSQIFSCVISVYIHS